MKGKRVHDLKHILQVSRNQQTKFQNSILPLSLRGPAQEQQEEIQIKANIWE